MRDLRCPEGGFRPTGTPADNRNELHRPRSQRFGERSVRAQHGAILEPVFRAGLWDRADAARATSEFHVADGRRNPREPRQPVRMLKRPVHTHRIAMVPLFAMLAGLLAGVALHQSTGAARAALDYPRPGDEAPLTPRTVRSRPVETAVSRADSSPRGASAVAPALEPAPASEQAAAGSSRTPNSRAFAGLTDLTLQLPFGVRAIGFHESGHRSALPLHPMGIPRVNENITRLSRAPVSDGFEYHVLGTRGRGNAATSAVDLSIPHNTPVTSPVTGTVLDASSYLLYREVPDNAVYIVPDRRPDVVVVLMHLNGLKVNAGDRVTANQTVIALTGRLLPFDSQIDRYAGRHPHVHLEVRSR